VLVLGGLVSSASAKYAGGSGTAEDPYRIEAVEHLIELSQTSADWDSDFKLVADLDMADVNEADFEPIGHVVAPGHADNRPFTGTFDGGGKRISNFTYRDMQNEYVGLFRYVTTGEIKNVRLVRAMVLAGGNGTGALVGYLDGGSIKDCSAESVRVSGNIRVGALIGRVNAGASRCWSSGQVNGVRYVGGLVGSIDKGSVNRCYSTADVWGQNEVGGLAGVALHEYSTVMNSYAKGSVDGMQYVGGLVGALGSARASQCYSTGRVSGLQRVGGLIGTVFQGDTSRCYWDVESSGQETSAGREKGKTTAEMRHWGTYSGFDWINTWTICEGMNTPVLWWQIPAGDLSCPDGVQWLDFALFAMHWRERFCGPANDCGGADLDDSGQVGYPDLAIFARDWLAGTE
jgi:hypothetical protein